MAGEGVEPASLPKPSRGRADPALPVRGGEGAQRSGWSSSAGPRWRSWGSAQRFRGTPFGVGYTFWHLGQ